MRAENNQEYHTEGGNGIHDIDLDPLKFKEEKQPNQQLHLLGVQVQDLAAGFRTKVDTHGHVHLNAEQFEEEEVKEKEWVEENEEDLKE
jgi:hypothetical protein